MYRYTDWDWDWDGKDNYIKPQEIKQELENKAMKQNITLNRKKAKENKNVTFSVDDKKLQRSKSVNDTSSRFVVSNL